jgi:DNA invertase Pin-like site-specific DNA recombinase
VAYFLGRGSLEVGVERAKAEGRYKGREPLDKAVVDMAKELLAKGMKKNEVAKQLKIGESTLYKYLAIQ